MAASVASVDSPYLNEVEAAKYLRLGVKTLQNMRVAGLGPLFRRHGKMRVLYKVSDLDAWSDERTRRSTSGKGR